MPQERCARLKEIFGAADHDENELGTWLKRVRKAVIAAASTLQYDSAVLPAKQLDIPDCVPPEAFSANQQRQSRMDGGTEEDGQERDNVPITGPP